MYPNSQSRLQNWALAKASSPRAPLWIGILFFLELTLFIPLDAVLMFFCLQERSKIPLYIVTAAVASVASGLCGYLLGHFLWDMIHSFIIPYLISPSSFAKVSAHFQVYEHWAVFFGGLLPFPLKVLSLGAGVFDLGMIPFALTLFAARSLRFMLIGGAMALWGETVKKFAERHFRKIVFILGAKIMMVFFGFWFLVR